MQWKTYRNYLRKNLALFAAERLQKANEDALQANIQQGIERLSNIQH